MITKKNYKNIVAKRVIKPTELFRTNRVPKNMKPFQEAFEKLGFKFQEIKGEEKTNKNETLF